MKTTNFLDAVPRSSERSRSSIADAENTNHQSSDMHVYKSDLSESSRKPMYGGEVAGPTTFSDMELNKQVADDGENDAGLAESLKKLKLDLEQAKPKTIFDPQLIFDLELNKQLTEAAGAGRLLLKEDETGLARSLQQMKLPQDWPKFEKTDLYPEASNQPRRGIDVNTDHLTSGFLGRAKSHASTAKDPWSANLIAKKIRPGPHRRPLPTVQIKDTPATTTEPPISNNPFYLPALSFGDAAKHIHKIVRAALDACDKWRKMPWPEFRVVFSMEAENDPIPRMRHDIHCIRLFLEHGREGWDLTHLPENFFADVMSMVSRLREELYKVEVSGSIREKATPALQKILSTLSWVRAERLRIFYESKTEYEAVHGCRTACERPKGSPQRRPEKLIVVSSNFGREESKPEHARLSKREDGFTVDLTFGLECAFMAAGEAGVTKEKKRYSGSKGLNVDEGCANDATEEGQNENKDEEEGPGHDEDESLDEGMRDLLRKIRQTHVRRRRGQAEGNKEGKNEDPSNLSEDS